MTEPCLDSKLSDLKLEYKKSYGFSALLEHFKTSRLLLVKPRLEGKVPGTSFHDGIQQSKRRPTIQFRIKDT